MAVTLESIAEKAGVTPKTVSNILRGHYKAQRADAARRAQQVRELADQLGYRVSSAAKATRTGRTGFIGMIRSPLLACSVHAPAFDAGVDNELHRRDLCLVRDIIDDATSAEDVRVPRIVREDAVDGILVNYAFGTPPAIRDVLDRCRIPAIWINRKRDHNCVHPADEGAAREATAHLLAHGHRRVGFVASHWAIEPHYSAVDRRGGYERVMLDAGLTPELSVLPPKPRNTLGGGFTLKSIVDLLRRPDRPSALLFEGAVGRVALHAAEILRLRVPGDVSIMTFDTEAGADENAAVDRVLVPYLPMGRAAVSELCALIDEPEKPRRPVVLPFEFHLTGTVARPSVSG